MKDDTLPLVTGGDRGFESVAKSLFDGVHNPHIANPTLFNDTYPKTITFDPKNPGSVFGAGNTNRNKPVAQRNAREVLPGIYSFDPDMIKFQRRFATSVDADLKPEIDENLFSLNGMHTNMATVMTVSGFPQLPVSALPRDNAKFVKQLGLAGKMTTRQRAVATAVWDLVWGSYKPSAINIPKLSATGPVRMTNDPEYKLQFALAMQTHGRMERMLQTFMSGDLGALHRDFEIAPIMGVNVRWQVDKPGKVRKSWSLQDCLRDPSPDQHVITTKVGDFLPHAADFAAMRCRLINAGPWTINCVLQMVATGTMYAMFEQYASTWHKDEDTLDQFCSGKDIWCGDVSNYDHSFTEEMIDLSLDRGREFWDPRLMQVAESLYYAAYFARPLGPDDKIGAMVGDPRDYLNKQVIAGNRSGHAFTSLMAKVWKVIDTLCVFDAMGYDAIKDLKPLLKGEMPLGMLNNGDDETVWFDRPADYAFFMKIRDNQPENERMFKVEREVGQVYSGKVFQKVGDRQYKSVERLNTTFERTLCPERSIGGFFRPYWPIGLLERFNRRNSHPVLEQMWDKFDEAWAIEMAPTHGSYLGIIDRAAKSMPFNVNGLNWKDIAVLEDPSKLHHRWTPDEIDANVVKSSISRLHHSHFAGFYGTYYQGNLV
ncbi:P2 [Pseudomonas phage phi2954]|uniref:RNA-directed RNA polymerase n=1 Tax=Pseudomonas phage phi2954 TaxID=593131 RepID=C0KIT7_9VIRU|nr:P2 [Pseudomonas phage phi2954]ACM91122.2 P2 [Pseudomonas phage phi2954]